MSSAEPMVDVGIPTIGRAPYLAEAVASVVAQSFPSWRLVVSEDGTDGCCARELLGPFLDDHRIRFVSTPAGRNAARHKTQLMCAGTAPYVAILDNDDRWRPDFLERSIAFMQRHPECALVFSRSRVIDERGRDLGCNDPRLEPGVQEGGDFIRHLLRLGNVVTSSGAVVRRSAYAAVGSGHDPGFVVGYDLLMWIRLAASSRVGYLDGDDVEYRLHPGQATAAPLDCEERVQLLDHIEALLERVRPDVRFDSHYPRRRRAFCLLGAALDAAERGDRQATRDHVRRAATTHPIAIVHPAAGAALMASTLGGTGSGALSHARSLVRRAPRPLEGREKAKAMGRPTRRRALDPPRP